MKEELDNLYLNYLKEIFSDKELEDMIEGHILSSPQLIDIETARGDYLNSEFKLLFIGKETNGWFNPQERKAAGLTQINRQFSKYMESLKQVYFRHNIGANYRSPIYLFIDLLLDKISEIKKTGVLLTELLRHDYFCAGLPNELIPKIAYDNNFILRKEVDILRPNALVFLTGPTYDKHISLTFPLAVFRSHKGYSKNEVSIIEGIPNIEKAIRIYHPDYHNRRGAEFKHQMADVITKFLWD